jgi:hypothetical protein
MRERKQGEKLRGRKESGSEEDDRGRRERGSEEEDGDLSLLPLPHSYPSFSLPLSLLPLSHPHHLSILHSFQSATSLPLLFPVILSSTSLPLSFEGREVVRRRMERNEGEEGEREAVRKRMERKGEKGSEEDDYFNKFPPTM